MDFTNQLETVMKYFSVNGGFLSTKSKGTMNTMTVSWGFIGFIWSKPHFIAVVRPQRFTKPRMDETEDFTISVPFGTMKEELKICGTKSGADFDKSSVVNFSEGRKVNSPVVDGCDVFYECKKIYVDKLNEESLPPEIRSMFYNDDFHHVYIGEIVECYSR